MLKLHTNSSFYTIARLLVGVAGLSLFAAPARATHDDDLQWAEFVARTKMQKHVGVQPAVRYVSQPDFDVGKAIMLNFGNGANSIGGATAGGAGFVSGAPRHNAEVTFTFKTYSWPGQQGEGIQGGIAYADDGTVWFTVADRGVINGNTNWIDYVGRLGLDEQITLFPIPMRVAGATDFPSAIALGWDGAMWFTELVAPRVGRITKAGAVTFFPLPSSLESAQQLVGGPDGAMWYTASAGANGRIGRITTAGVVTEFPVPTSGAQPQGIVPGPDGAMWFTEPGVNKIGRITLQGLVKEFALPTPGAQPWEIDWGPDNALWFAEPGINKIGRITPGGVVTEYSPPSANSAPGGVGMAGDGAIWISETGTDQLGRATLAPNLPATWTVAATGDVDGAGKADILWRDSAGNFSASLMNGAAIASSALLANLPIDWKVAGSGDFNGDGPGHKTDILWRNGATGDVVVSLMNGASITSSTFVANLPRSWDVAGVGDFDADGKADILWRNLNGDAVVSKMNGASIVSSTFVASLPGNWGVAGVADFSGDGAADILWRNATTGDYVVSFMNGPAITSSAFLARTPSSWVVAGVADFNNDHKADILWRNVNGDTIVSLVNGSVISSSLFVANPPATWSVAGVGDFAGDGASDILWRDAATGNLVVSLMSGGVISASTLAASLP
ncbi:virginiamycin B lyase family protein [Methylocystis parvus]|uniref:VCBS repeat-containing protein n=1 Tax=Methylocystis parvus TaxID=134 RepID=A0A6B8M6H5_9HYPH|nr:FG-GAP-like repeat-containing protein [Methylocystis parvus]QGM98016.1 hypothetical protein F7D14_11365 [Methylocystis parvus]WBK01668.1 FG-GAP-like repeat-containing protein [Methylocystis parvus OBBP]